MPKIRHAIGNASFGPNTTRMLGEIFDEVWASVMVDFGGDPAQIEADRMRLAIIILELAQDGQLGPDQITRTAQRLIRQTRPSRG